MVTIAGNTIVGNEPVQQVMASCIMVIMQAFAPGADSDLSSTNDTTC